MGPFTVRLAKSAIRFGQWYVITSSSNRIRNFVTPIRHPWRTCTGNLMEKCCEILKVWYFLYKQERHHRGMLKWYLNERFQKASWIRDLPNHGFPLCKCFIVYKCSLDMPKAVNYLWKYVFNFWCFNQIFEGVAISSGFIKSVFLSRIFVTQSITKCPRRQQYCIFFNVQPPFRKFKTILIPFTCARVKILCVAIMTSQSWMGLWRLCWHRQWLWRMHCTDWE